MLTLKPKRAAPADIEKLRAEIAKLQTERAAIADAPPTREDLLAALDRAISMRAKEYQARLDGLRPGGDIRVALREYAPSNDGLISLRSACLFSPDAVRARYAELIDAAVEAHPPGLPESERKAALANLDGKLADVEIEEEKAVATAEDQGETILRRPDFSPAIFFRAHTSAAGIERMADLALQVETAHASMLFAIDKLREVKHQKGKRITQIQALDRDVPVGRGDAGELVYANAWKDAADAIGEEFAADLARLEAATERAKAAWEPVGAVVQKLQHHAEAMGLIGGAVDWQGGSARINISAATAVITGGAA